MELRNEGAGGETAEQGAQDSGIDLAVVGAGAAGLMAAIQAGRAAPGLRLAVLDGARTLGAKILVSGGGRCNVTHERVEPEDFAGASPRAIGKVLRELDVAATRRFFAGLGVALKREPTGKLFPVDDRARTVLDALLAAAHAAGAALRHPFRVEQVERTGSGFRLAGPHGELAARRVILACGGCALPKSGSDGSGYALVRSLGHTTTAIFPALVPLTLPAAHPFRALAGISAPARLEVRGASGRRLAAFSGPLLCTHFGISGPVVLDASRHYLAARATDAATALVVALWPGAAEDEGDAVERSRAEIERELLRVGGRTVGAWLAERLPDRLAAALLGLADVDAATAGARLTRPARHRLVDALTALPLPIAGDRGFADAEATAGGVPLTELDLATFESRLCPGLHLCGELLDVDGRIGGFNFQWAWASGTVAGRGAAGLLAG